MASSASSWLCSFLALFIVFSGACGQLSPTFYSITCPNLLALVGNATKEAVDAEKRMGASLLRLHFHDCFVQGCDGSILLDNAPGIASEKAANGNANSVRGFEVMDAIKAKVEAACPGVVSCADILALAARDSTVQLNGPTWTVPLGRRDSMNASLGEANNDLPPPFFDIDGLIAGFVKKGFTAREMVALSGAHTIGSAQCANYRSRIYNETNNIDSVFAAKLKNNCASAAGATDANLAPLDKQTDIVFDNRYYADLANRQGLLHSDQLLYNPGGTQSQASVVNLYNSNSNTFFNDFAAAMVKMGNLAPPTGTAGQVRLNCRVVNS